MGSERFRTARLQDFHVTEAWFPPGTVIDPHVHERATFAVMLEGSFDLSFPARDYACPPATVFTEPLGDRHANRIDRVGARVLVVQPDPDRADFLRPCRELLGRVHHFRHEGLAGLARRLVWELQAPDTAAPLAIEALALEMLATAARDGGVARNGRPPDWLERAREIVHARWRENLRIGDIAEEVGVRPVRLARSFRASYRLPLGTYIRRLRLDWAADRLAESSDSLASIAFRCGFSDQSHFTRAFKRHTGRTPHQFRLALRSSRAMVEEVVAVREEVQDSRAGNSAGESGDSSSV
jgi:AraC family transcriptional regulator